MTTYQVDFRSDAALASHAFEADTPQQALSQAQSLYADQPWKLWFEAYDGKTPVNEITVNDSDGNEVAVWLDDELRLRLAASDLLAALEQAVTALNTAPRFAIPNLESDSYKIAAMCDRAIAKAKGGAA